MSLCSNCTLRRTALPARAARKAASRSRSHVTSALFGSTKTVEKPVSLQGGAQRRDPRLEKLNKEAKNQKSSDAELLYQAKYGPRSADGKLSPEQYAALARRARGTARDFFKDFVQPDVKEAYLKPTESTQVPYFGFLVGVVVALLGTTVYVVAATGH